MARTSARVLGAKELKALAKDLKQQENGKERRKEMVQGLRKAVKPMVPALRAAIQRIPSKGHGPRKGRKGTLRSEFSRSVTTQVRTTGKNAGAAVFMNPRKMPDGTKSLPAYFEQKPGYTRLRHPTFGNWELPQQQKVPPRGYFTQTVVPLIKDAREVAEEVIKKTAKDLES